VRADRIAAGHPKADITVHRRERLRELHRGLGWANDRLRAVIGCFEVSAFIGRADELEALAEVAREASNGLFGAIVVGEPRSEQAICIT
jgi:hypothetical protein